MDDKRREIRDGWVAITDGFVTAIGEGVPPRANQLIDATDCLVTPGLVNTHHHLYH